MCVHVWKRGGGGGGGGGVDVYWSLLNAFSDRSSDFTPVSRHS